MGSCTSTCKRAGQDAVAVFCYSWKSQPRRRVLVLGLDAAGKTTLLYKIKRPSDSVDWIITSGLCVETLTYNNMELLAWDLGGACRIIPPWLQYLENTAAVVFVVDAADRDRIWEAAHELRALFKYKQLRDAKLLVLVNKQDKPGCMTTREVHAKLNLDSMAANQFRIKVVSVIRGEGVQGGFDWLGNALFGKPEYM